MKRILIASLALLLAGETFSLSAAGQHGAGYTGPMPIEALSTRPDPVSGGDVLVAIERPLHAAGMTVTLNGRGAHIARLGEGYAIFTNTLNHPTNSCNAFLAGETTMMGKEHLIEEFGVPDFTVSIGSSGGAYTSLHLADEFPGLDGIPINATLPDALSIAWAGSDAHLLAHYLQTIAADAFTPAQEVAVCGYQGTKAFLVAGGPLDANVLKCQLTPIDEHHYPSLTAVDLKRLRAIVRGGVCDYARPGVNQTPVVPWASFGPAPEKLIFDARKPASH